MKFITNCDIFKHKLSLKKGDKYIYINIWDRERELNLYDLIQNIIYEYIIYEFQKYQYVKKIYTKKDFTLHINYKEYY